MKNETILWFHTSNIVAHKYVGEGRGQMQTLKRILFVVFLLILLVISVTKNSSGDERAVKEQYYSSIDAIDKLYGYHQEEDGLFYNTEFTNKTELEAHLTPYILEPVLNEVVDTLYQTDKEKLVYEDDYQQYLLNERENRRTSNYDGDLDYYQLISESLLNPGLKLIQEKDLVCKHEGDQMVLEVENYKVQFYEGEEYFSSQHFSKRGYPSEDWITLKMTFVKEKKDWKVKSYHIQTRG